MGKEDSITTIGQALEEREGERRPAFETLPLHCDHPPCSAWGLYGAKDELGTLNLLTPSRVLSAKSEITEGFSVSLKSVTPLVIICSTATELKNLVCH